MLWHNAVARDVSKDKECVTSRNSTFVRSSFRGKKLLREEEKTLWHTPLRNMHVVATLNCFSWQLHHTTSTELERDSI